MSNVGETGQAGELCAGLRADAPSVAEQEAMMRAYTAPFPGGFRAWCRGVRVQAGGRGMVMWEAEGWHGEIDAGLVAGDVALLKARDRHCTTNAILLHLWQAMWVPESAGFYVTRGEVEAYQGVDSFKSRMEGVYRDLPAWQRAACRVSNGSRDGFGTQGEVEVAQEWAEPVGRAFLRVATATKDVGATGAYTLATLDEMARYEDADGVLEAIAPSVRRTGGHIWVLGTLTSESHTGTRLVQEFLAMREGAKPGTALFVGYGSRAGETKERYAELEAVARRRGPAGLLELHRQYPRTVEEALAERAGGLLSAEAVAACYKPMESRPVPAALEHWNRLG